jgi:membrane protein DedA with SNARE-associated domain
LVDITALFPFDQSLGYLGLFAFSFFGSVIIFLPVPYFFVLAAMSLDPVFDPNLLALSSATGAAAGKMVVFYGSYYGRRILKDETRRRMRPLEKLVSRYGWLAAFIAAATPIPDDLVYIPLGLSKYNPALFFGATFGGKIVLSEIVAWSTSAGLSSYIQPLLENVNDINVIYISAIIFTAILAVVIYYTLKIDWTKSIGKWFPWTMGNNHDKDKPNEQ